MKYVVEDSCDRSGYVLLLVLVLLVILVTALASVATRTLRTSQQASKSAALLQQRWGIRSAQQACLPFAFQTFKDLAAIQRDTRANQAELAPNRIEASIMLGGLRFDLILSDENSKLNLNTVYHNGGPRRMTKAVQTFLGPLALRSFAPLPAVPSSQTSRVNLSEGGEERAKSKAKDNFGVDSSASGLTEFNQFAIPAFRSWGEVFDFTAMANESRTGTMNFDFMDSLTLWGRGQVNVANSSDQVILQLLETTVPKVDGNGLLKEIRANTEIDLLAFVDQKIGDPNERRIVASLLRSSSYTFSLFVDVASNHGHSRRLFVTASDVDGTTQTSEFVFH